jgi:hypothetical protein
VICEPDLKCPIKRAYRLNDDAIQAIKELQQRLRATSRGIPGPDAPLSFDPESDAMQLAEAKIREMMGEIADAAGLPPDLAYAIRRTGLVVTDRNKDLLDSAQTAAWNDALAEYQMLMKIV